MGFANVVGRKMNLTDEELAMIHDVRLSLNGRSNNQCVYCTMKLRRLLGRGRIVCGSISEEMPHTVPLSHFWLELDDDFIVDVTADQFNDIRFVLPEIVLGKRSELKVYHVGQMYDPDDFDVFANDMNRIPW